MENQTLHLEDDFFKLIALHGSQGINTLFLCSLSFFEEALFLLQNLLVTFVLDLKQLNVLEMGINLSLEFRTLL